ncbi:MAG TPA: hypothetical protein VIO94_02155 [Phenylobacterium sp.]
MKFNAERLIMIFVGVFALSIIAVGVYTVVWAEPARKCAEANKWWDAKGRVCATPVMISDITGRTPQDTEAEAAARARLNLPPRVGPAQRVAPERQNTSP